MSELELPGGDGIIQTPGQQLAAARAAEGLGVADIARQLKLSPSQVEALEADHYERLPGIVFVRGFIRNYARLLKLDPAPLLASAECNLQPPARPEHETSVSADIPFPTGREIKWRRYVIVALALLVPVVIFEFYHDEAPDVTTAKSGEVTLPAQQPAGADAKPKEIERVTPAAVAEAAPDPAQAMTVGGEPDLTAQAASDERKPGEHHLKFVFEQESWVEIRDRDGHKIFSQLNPAGTEQAVSGVPPLSLVIGNAPGVRLTYNDQLVDLAPHTRIDVARLTLE